MRVIKAENTGFCFGVRRAIEMAERLADERGTVYTLGELIHNRGVIEELEEKGVHAVESASLVPSGATVIIRSHGVSPEVMRECEAAGLETLDATCPFVMNIHDSVAKAYSEGKSIAICGRRDHPECIGINGCCDNTAVFLREASDVDALDSEKSYLIVAQTTSSAEAFEEIAKRARDILPCAEIENTLCPTTIARQKEAAELAKRCSVMLVIGDRDSSNTRKLYEVALASRKRVISLTKVDELALEKIYTDDIIGIVSGASAPDSMIMEVITRMSEQEKTMAENPVKNEEVLAEAAATVEEPIVTESSEVTAADENAEAAEKTENADPSFAEEFEKTLVRIRNGQIITGSVVQIVDGEVCVNIGYKSDGFIPRNEFSSDPDVDPAEAVKVGDSIEVEVIKVNDGEGNVLLSRKNVESKKMWDTLISDEDIADKVFEAVGKEAVKGGLIATIDGVRAFVPASQLSTKYVENIAEFVGQPITLKIIEVDKARKRIVASHKAVMQLEAEEAKKQRWAELEVGSKVKGVVRRLTDFGAFVDIGGIDGLVHVTDVAWGRVKHPKDVLSIGQEIEVLIRDVDVEKQRVSLGYKQLQPKPWTMADEKYPVGSIVEGKVVRIVTFGAFVSLEPTIDGLIHISQVGLKRIAKVEDEINVGDVVRCKVLDVNTEGKRISLSRREAILEEHPEIAEELAAEKAEHDRQMAEQRQAAAEAAKQEQQARQERRQSQPQERRNSAPTERRERSERPRREENDYILPPEQSVTTSLGSLFAAALGGDKKDEE